MSDSAKHGYGTLVKVEDPGSPGSYLTIGEVGDIELGGFKASKIGTTTHNDAATTPYETFIPGLLDPGDVKFKILYLSELYTHQLLWTTGQGRIKRKYRTYEPNNGEILEFNAYVMEMPRKFPTDDAISSDITLGVTGGYTKIQ